MHALFSAPLLQMQQAGGKTGRLNRWGQGAKCCPAFALASAGTVAPRSAVAGYSVAWRIPHALRPAESPASRTPGIRAAKSPPSCSAPAAVRRAPQFADSGVPAPDRLAKRFAAGTPVLPRAGATSKTPASPPAASSIGDAAVPENFAA